MTEKNSQLTDHNQNYAGGESLPKLSKNIKMSF